MNVFLYQGVNCILGHNSINTAPFVDVKFAGMTQTSDIGVQANPDFKDIFVFPFLKPNLFDKVCLKMWNNIEIPKVQLAMNFVNITNIHTLAIKPEWVLFYGPEYLGKMK
jgi:hypothetical protein